MKHRTPHTTRPFLLALAIATVLVAVAQSQVAFAAGAARQAQPTPKPTTTSTEVNDGSATYDELAGCVSTTGKLLVVMLIDESGSLQGTDPKGVRVAAAKTALSGLAGLTEEAAGGADVDVLVATFSNTFKTAGAWAALTKATVPALQGEVDGLAARNTGMDTDFINALSGAREALAQQAVVVGEDEDEVCKVILLFTDGRYDIGVRTTPAEEAKYGTAKTYAPGILLDSEASVRQVEALGVKALCNAGGVADQVRADDIATLTIALTAKIRPAEQEFLEAVTQGKSGGQTCGKRDGSRSGVFLAASNLESLIGTFDGVATRIAGGSPSGPPVAVPACPDEPCDKGKVEFAVDETLRRLHLFVTVPTPQTRIELQGPTGEPIVISERTEATTDAPTASIRSAWPSPKAATIDITPHDGSTGTWTLTLVDPDPPATKGTVQVYTFTDVVARLTSSKAVEVGTTSALTADVVAKSTQKPVKNLREASVVAVITDPVAGTVTEVPFDEDDGSFKGDYEAPEGLTTSVLRVVLKLEAITRDGVTLSTSSPEVSIPTRKPAGYPNIGPAELTFSPIDGGGVAEATLLLFGSGKSIEPGCLWIGEPTIAALPPAAGPLAFSADGAGTSQATCLEAPVGGNKTVTLKFDPDSRASGSVRGFLRVWTAPASGEALPTDIPFSFEMSRGIDTTKQLAVFLALLVIGLGLPLILLLAMNAISSKFQAVKYVLGANVPVLVRKSGHVRRVPSNEDEHEEDLHLYGYDFKPLAAQENPRQFAYAGLAFRARTPLNPFAPGYATAVPEEGAASVAREGRKVNLALSLAGSWIFLYDPQATDEASKRILGKVPDGEPPEIHGRLVAFVAKGPVPPQAERLLMDIFDRLPRTARRLNEIAGEARERQPERKEATVS